ncbi:hypothetical protein Hdeb2414_s0001g00032551 [Helianthus debilis subsp. tardiflorus]
MEEKSLLIVELFRSVGQRNDGCRIKSFSVEILALIPYKKLINHVLSITIRHINTRRES